MRDQVFLLTGGTGFVGGCLARHLQAQGVPPNRLRLLVRDPERAAAGGLPRESLVQGHLGDRAALQRAASGVHVVFHLAGAIRALSRAEFLEVNATGTAHLVAALRAAAPDCRLVHVSSLAAAGPSVHGETSSQPAARCRPCSNYGESKRRAELAVAALEDALPWIIVRPPVVYGPGDAATRLLLRQALAPLVPVPWTPRPLSLIHIDDLLRALVLAAEAPVTGCALPVEGPDRLDTHALMHALAAACGRRCRTLRVPAPWIWPAALATDAAAWLRRRPALFGRDKLRDIRAVGWVADPAPARDKLAFVPRIATATGFAEVAAAAGLR